MSFDFRSVVDAAPSLADRRGARAEKLVFAASVIPMTRTQPVAAERRLSSDRLHQIDRAFFGPFFREKYGAAGDRALENGRIRYYGPIQPAGNEGELAGRRYVHEFDTMTGCTRGWHETVDRTGKVRQIRPEWNDGDAARRYQFDSNGRYKGSW
jgi:hypothetical protein